MHPLLHDIALCIIAAWALGVIAQALGQPVILAYLAAGFALGPSGFSLVPEQESIATISELGLIFLLFMIGLEIDLKKIVRAGRMILFTGASQILAGCAVGVALFWLAGFTLARGHWDALYLGVAAAMSSTVIIVKVLYDKRELDTLPGRITLGVLVLQDLFAILFLAVQPSLDDLRASELLLSGARVLALLATTLLISRYVLPPLFRRIARLPELVLVGALSWCFLVGELAAQLHLSREMGALVAGVSLSTFPYALDVTAKVTSLRDFFVTLFFVALGMTIPLPTANLAWLALGFAAFVVLSRLLLTFLPLYAMRCGLRASLLPSINLCQVSEFSLVVMAMGLEKGHIAPETKGLVSLAFVGLAVASTFGMMRSDPLVRSIAPLLRRLGLRDLGDDSTSNPDSKIPARILIIGFFRTASSLLEDLQLTHPARIAEVAVVDFNPKVHTALRERGVRVFYGDISHPETLLHAGVPSAEILLCTIPDAILKGTTNLRLVSHLREMNPTAKIIVSADVLSDVPALYAAGANYVSVARLDESADLCAVLEAASCDLLQQKRAELDARLAKRNEVLP